MKRSGWPGWLMVAVLAAAWLPASSAVVAQTSEGPSAGVTPPLVARAQMHRNGLRASVYLPLATASSTAEPDTIPFAAEGQIALDGDGTVNARGNLYPIDVDGDGTYEFVHFNGYRLMRVYRADGTRLWQLDNPLGRLHTQLKNTDTLSILDTDGDGRQEIVHCWTADTGRTRVLVLRDGATGRVLRSVALEGQPVTGPCQIATFWMEGASEPVVLVAGRATGSGCRRNFIDTFSHVTAFTPGLDPRWERDTCDAGHYAWPLDENADGRAEAVFVGKYLYEADGRLRCTLPGYPNDHVDSMVVGDLDPERDGYEALTVGQVGTQLYRAADCATIWSRGGDLIRNPQHVAAAKDDPDAPPTLVVTQMSQQPGASSYLVDIAGSARRLFATGDDPMLRQIVNANLDGATAAEDRVTQFGQVIDDAGALRLSVDWYWDLQQLSAEERALPLVQQWTAVPLVFDLDDDGRDEIVTWGRELIVIGRGTDGGSGNGGGGGGGSGEKTPNKNGRDNAVRQR